MASTVLPARSVVTVSTPPVESVIEMFMGVFRCLQSHCHWRQAQIVSLPAGTLFERQF